MTMMIIISLLESTAGRPPPANSSHSCAMRFILCNDDSFANSLACFCGAVGNLSAPLSALWCLDLPRYLTANWPTSLPIITKTSLHCLLAGVAFTCSHYPGPTTILAFPLQHRLRFPPVRSFVTFLRCRLCAKGHKRRRKKRRVITARHTNTFCDSN